MLLLAASTALAQEEAPVDPGAAAQVAAIRELVLYARYADAERALTEFSARTDLTPAQRNEALEIRAIILLARRQRPRADEVLRELYGRDPEHRLVDRDVGPEVRAAFERIRDTHPPRVTITLENQTVDPTTRQSPQIAVRTAEGVDVVHELRVSYRNGASGGFERVIMRLDDDRSVGRARIPLDEGTAAYELQYYVEALAPSAAVIGTLGSETEPLTLSVPAEIARVALVPTGSERETPRPAGGGSVAEEWWFWTLIVVLVAGAGVGIGVGMWQYDMQVQPGSLGDGHL